MRIHDWSLTVAVAAILALEGTPTAAQNVPGGAVEALLAHAAATYASSDRRLVVEIDGFPSPEAASRFAARLGLRAGLNADLVACNSQRTVCRIPEGERVVRLMSFTVVNAGSLVRAQVIVSSEWESPDGQFARLLPTLRELVIENAGGWRVTEDTAQVVG